MPTETSGYYLTGGIDDPDAPEMWLARILENGDPMWQYVNDNEPRIAYNVKEIGLFAKDGFALVGAQTVEPYQATLFRLDAQLGVLWAQEVGPTTHANVGLGVYPQADSYFTLLLQSTLSIPRVAMVRVNQGGLQDD